MLKRFITICNKGCCALVIAALTIYKRFISTGMGYNCRFTPSCSEYTVLALQRFGMIRGLFLAVRRLLRCHPWCEGGLDAVPEKLKQKVV